MMFQIENLPREAFAHLFDLSDAELADRNALRVTANEKPGFPCRISLKDADPGETLILTNHKHLVGPTPYAASHAVYVREAAEDYRPDPGEVPDVLGCRLLSVRGLDAQQMIVEADIVDGADLAPALERFFTLPVVQEVHIHYAKRGCFAARAVRSAAD